MASKTQKTKYTGVYQRGTKFSYTIKVKTAEGKWKQEWHSGFDTAAKAKKARDSAVTDHRRGEHTPRSGRTVAEYMNEWVEGLVNLKPATVHGYKVQIRTHIVPGIGSVRLQELSTTTLNRFYRELHQPSDTQQRPLAPRTVGLCHATLRKALNDGVRAGELKVNPTLHATLPRQEKPDLTEPWTAVQVGKFLEAVEDHPLRAAFILAATTGARRGEIAGLRWKDVDLDSGQIHIRQSRTTINGQVVSSTPKNKTSERSISIDERTTEALRQHRKRQVEARLALGIGAPSETDCVFQEEDGTDIHPNRLSRAFKSVAKGAGLPEVRFHDLRHSFASITLKQGVPAEVVSKRLGHASPVVTLTIYRHVLAEEDKAAVDAFADAVYGDVTESSLGG